MTALVALSIVHTEHSHGQHLLHPCTRRCHPDPRRRGDRFIKTGHLTVNAMIGLQDNYAGISSTLTDHVVHQGTKSSAAYVPGIGLPMSKVYMDGLLFFEGGRELHIVAYDVSRTNAQVHVVGLGLLPIHFYITFDDFLTVGKCRLAWRYRDDIGVIFERWLDIPQHKALDQSR